MPKKPTKVLSYQLWNRAQKFLALTEKLDKELHNKILNVIKKHEGDHVKNKQKEEEVRR